jgi:hypothetical protein
VKVAVTCLKMALAAPSQILARCRGMDNFGAVNRINVVQYTGLDVDLFEKYPLTNSAKVKSW